MLNSDVKFIPVQISHFLFLFYIYRFCWIQVLMHMPYEYYKRVEYSIRIVHQMCITDGSKE